MSKSLPVLQPANMVPGSTLRRDAWWVEPLIFVAVLGTFTVYATWAALQNAHYFVAPYLSPFYSPCLATSCQEVTAPLFGKWYSLSPAFLILWIPGGFRATCYYYRRSYYRSFGSPPGCAVRDRSATYKGETRFPLLLQNVHRYFFWLALLVVAFLWWDAIRAFMFPDGFGIGIGTLVLVVNATLLSLYSFSCHSCRHIAGGHVNQFSKSPGKYRLWKALTKLNERHNVYAWISLFGVGLADLYVRLLSMGVVHDVRFI